MRELLKMTYAVAFCGILAASAWQAVQIAQFAIHRGGQELRQFENQLIAEAVARTMER